MAPHSTAVGQWTRRGVVTALLAVGGAGLLGCTAAKTSVQPTVEESDDPFGDATEESTPGFEVVIGDYSATVADGWTSVDDGKGGAVLTSGANRLTVMSVKLATSALAVDAIPALAKTHSEGFAGTFAEPVDRSSPEVKRASVAGTGTFQGSPARLLCELWVDSTGFALLTTRVLTAKPDSHISAQAQEMVDQLTLDF